MLYLTLKCIKIYFGWGYAPDPAWGAYSAPPDPLAGFKGPYFYGEGGAGREGKGGGGDGGGGRGKGGGAGEGRDPCFWVTPPEIESYIKPWSLGPC